MIEIIERKEGVRNQKRYISGWKVQVSYNDWGHIAVRVIHNDTPMEDTLVVFDKKTSERIIHFCQNKISHADRLPVDDFEDIPF